MMRSLAFLLVVIGLTSALPLVFEQTAQQKPNERVFMVRVDEAKQAELPKPAEHQSGQQPEQQQPPKRDFPWPYPPVFEKYLPEEVKQRLTTIFVDQTLAPEQRANQINGVFDSLPQSIIEQLPLPSEYERLPADVYARILYVHTAQGFSWNERQLLTRFIIESLPENERQLLSTPKLGGPPYGFERVLPPTVYKQLLFVHHDPRLNHEQKAHQITLIMRQVPQQMIEMLPMPKGMSELPMELQKRLRALVYDYSVEQPVRAQRVKEFVSQLPDELRPALRR
jgi:hypothetical protein